MSNNPISLEKHFSYLSEMEMCKFKLENINNTLEILSECNDESIEDNLNKIGNYIYYRLPIVEYIKNQYFDSLKSLIAGVSSEDAEEINTRMFDFRYEFKINNTREIIQDIENYIISLLK